MGGHFEAIGIADGDEDLGAALDRIVAETGEWTESARDTRSASWGDPSGAGVDLMVPGRSSGGLEPCATPQFAGGSTQTVVPTAIVPDPECPGCDLLHVEVHEDGEMVYPLLVAAARIHADREAVEQRLGEVVTARLTFVAEAIEVHDDVEAYHAALQSGDSLQLADRALIPTGLFGTAPTASALATGHVVSAEIRRTRLFGLPFHHLTIDGLGGHFDVVAAHGDLPDGARPGQIVRLSAWVCGRVC